MLSGSSRLATRLRAAGVALTLGAAAASLPGCATWAAPAWPAQPESRVFTSEAQRERTAREPAAPWYANRRDHQRVVVVGPRLPVVERSVTLTTDRQRIIRGRVFDHHRTTTYRREDRIGVR